MQISPLYQMELVDKIEVKLWSLFETSKYKKVKHYIMKWHHVDDYDENFHIIFQEEDKIALNETLHTIDPQTLLSIAVDLGIETPDYIPTVTLIKRVLRLSYKTASDVFDKALKNAKDDPDTSVSLSNATLESIIKHILDDERVQTQWKKTNTLYELTNCLLKELCLFPGANVPEEIKAIGSSLLVMTQQIEKLRSEKTFAHGKLEKDYIIEDSMYAVFVINAVSTIGLFLIGYYEKTFNNRSIVSEAVVEEISIDDLPF